MKEKLELFIGPCVLESQELACEVVETLKKDLKKFEDDILLTFKGSFDKANRSSLDSYRGPGMDKGLKILEYIKKTFSLPVLTDFHLPSQAKEVASVVDVLQVPAFLCRQTDMISEGAKACKKFNSRLKIKKGQFLSPEETENIIDKATPFLAKNNILLTERGVSFGYNNLVVDMASFQIMKKTGVKTVHDATHCVQRPGGQGKTSGGKREQIRVLAKAALAAGADAIFMETHPRVDEAKSDGATSWPLDKTAQFVEELLKIYHVSHP